MSLLSLAARLILAVVFAVAGIAKLADPTGSRKAVADFGTPEALTRPIAFLLPFAELACAVALIPAASAWWGAAGAIGLLLVFCAAIAVSLARGRKPDCHCFGQLRSEPIGASTLVRNGLLLAMGAFVLTSGAGPGLADGLAHVSSSGSILLVIAVAALLLALLELWAIVHLLSQNGRLLLRLDAIERKVGLGGGEESVGLPVKSVAPSFSAATLGGGTTSLAAVQQLDRPILLVFSAPNCSACDAALPEIAAWQREHAERLAILLVTQGDDEVNRAKKNQNHLRNVVLQTDREIEQAYKITATPSAVLIDDGLIASPVAQGIDAIRELVTKTTLPPPLKRGAPVPSVLLTDLDGRSTDVSGVGLGRLLVFWNPSCGFCSAMLDDLKAWERNRPHGMPELLIISMDSVEANRAQGLRSPVLLDPDFRVGTLLGSTGTPSAVLVDERGLVGSDVVTGAEAVLALAGAAPAAARR